MGFDLIPVVWMGLPPTNDGEPWRPACMLGPVLRQTHSMSAPEVAEGSPKLSQLRGFTSPACPEGLDRLKFGST